MKHGLSYLTVTTDLFPIQGVFDPLSEIPVLDANSVSPDQMLRFMAMLSAMVPFTGKCLHDQVISALNFESQSKI